MLAPCLIAAVEAEKDVFLLAFRNRSAPVFKLKQQHPLIRAGEFDANGTAVRGMFYGGGQQNTYHLLQLLRQSRPQRLLRLLGL